MYAEAIDNLQAEFDALEQENAQLKKKNATNTKKEDKRISIPKKSSEYDLDHDESNSAMEMDSITLYEMNNQVSLEFYLRNRKKVENTHLLLSQSWRHLNLLSAILEQRMPT
jgi:dynactin 1